MKILFVCHRFPFPPSRGGKIRPFNIIRHLSRQHDVTVASLARSDEEAEAGKGLAEHCHKILLEQVSPAMAQIRMVSRLASREPSSMGYFYSPKLAERITEEIATTAFDLIFVHCSSVAQYVEKVDQIPKILDFGDMDSQKWLAYAKVFGLPKSLGYWLEGQKLQQAETGLARRFDYCTCTTRAELASLQDYGVPTPSGWFPNGVDLEKFQPSGQSYDPNGICFVGRMDYFPNQQCMLDFCRHTFPLIRERRPETTLTIIGAEPSAEIRRLSDLPGVEVTGTVPDVRPLVQNAAVSVAPLQIARGTQNKILESLAMGVPVVTSPAAAGGVDAVPGRHLVTAADPPAVAKAVLELLENPDVRQTLALAGRARMESHHSWQSSMQRLDTIINTCLERPVVPAA